MRFLTNGHMKPRRPLIRILFHSLVASLLVAAGPARGMQITYEGDRLFTGRNQDVGQANSDWRMDVYDTNCKLTIDDGQLNMRLIGGYPGSDGAILHTGIKASDGSQRLAHTIDVSAARPGCFWKQASQSAGGMGWSVAVPVDSSSCKKYRLYLGDAGPGADPRIADQLTVVVYHGAKGQIPHWHKIRVPGLRVDRMNRYRMTMDDEGRLDIYVNAKSEAIFSQSDMPDYLDVSNRAEFGLFSPRSQPNIFTTYRMDIDSIQIDTSKEKFGPPGVVPSTGRKPFGTIVVHPESVDMEYFGALELARYLEKITGTRPDITSKPIKRDSGSNVYLGNSAQVKSLLVDVDWNALGTDGIVIRKVDRDLVLSGGRPRGTLFAVYTFLEDTLGCRWWGPGAETIPRLPDVVLSDLSIKNIVYRSPFDFRIITAEGNGRPFAFKYRQNGGDVLFDPDGGSILQSWLPGRKYFVDHPEWYAYVPEKSDPAVRNVEIDFEGEYNWINGLRYVKEGRTEAMYQTAKRTHRLPWQPCMTSPGALEQVTKNVLDHLAEQYSNWKYPPKVVWIVQQDGGWMCHCERCRALRSKEGAQSAAWVRFVNAVAERVEKDYPDVLVGMHAYLHTIKPPKTVRPRDNVIIYMAVLVRDHKTPLGQLPHLGTYAAQWAEMSRHTWLWDYTAGFRNYIVPHPNHFVMGESIRYCDEIGFTGIRVQGSHGRLTELVYLRNWVNSQMMWDPRQDPRALVEEFLDGYYGPAAPFLSEYLDFLHQVIRRDGGTFLSCHAHDTKAWLTLADLNRATKLFNRAAVSVGDSEPYASRLATARWSVDIAWLLRYHQLKTQAGAEKTEFLAPPDPLALISELEKIQHSVGHYRERHEFPELVEKLKAELVDSSGQPGP